MVITGNAADVAAAYIAARKTIQTQLVNDGTANRNTYPTLANILKTITPTLIANGLVIMQETTSNEFGVGVSTTILHHSGASIDFAPLTMQPADLKPQTVGSTITYCRRYSLISALGLVGGAEDDDGEKGTVGIEVKTVKPMSNGYHEDELWEPRETVKAADTPSKIQLARIDTLGVKVYGKEGFAAESSELALWASDNTVNEVGKLNATYAEKLIKGLEAKLAKLAHKEK